MFLQYLLPFLQAPTNPTDVSISNMNPKSDEFLLVHQTDPIEHQAVEDEQGDVGVFESFFLKVKFITDAVA